MPEACTTWLPIKNGIIKTRNTKNSSYSRSYLPLIYTFPFPILTSISSLQGFRLGSYRIELTDRSGNCLIDQLMQTPVPYVIPKHFPTTESRVVHGEKLRATTTVMPILDIVSSRPCWLYHHCNPRGFRQDGLSSTE